MVQMGIDPSINSTGICVDDNGKYFYYIIASKLTKKQKEFTSDFIKLIHYDKGETKDLDYTEKETVKTENMMMICNNIQNIIHKHHPDIIKMEGVSYGSTGSAALVDLSGLNFMIRGAIIQTGVPFIIVSPTQNKKFAVANGTADKDVMVYSWKMVDKRVKNITEIKLDDLADAFFLSQYPERGLN